MAGGLKHNSTIAMSISAKDEVSPVLNRVNQSFKNTKKQTNALNQQFRFMRGGMGQLGHQIQDVAVQLQMGQNALLVFGQQGGQIASIFGHHGAVVGAFLAVGAAIATSLLPSLFKTSESMKEAEESAKDLALKVNELAGAQRDLAAIQMAQKMLEVSEAISDQQDKLAGLAEKVANQPGLYRNSTKAQEEYSNSVAEAVALIENLAEQQELLNHINSGGTEAGKKKLDQLDEEIAFYGLASEAINIYKIQASNLSKDEKKAATDRIIQLALLKKAEQDRVEQQKEAEKQKKEGLKNLEATMRAQDARRAQAERIAKAEESRQKLGLERIKKSLKTQGQLLKDQYDIDKELLEKAVEDKKERDNLLLQLEAKYLSDVAALKLKAAKALEKQKAEEIADAAEQMREQIRQQEEAMREFKDTYRPIFDELGDGFVDAITGAENFADSIKAMAKSVVDSLLRIAVQKLIIDQLFGAFTKKFGPSGGQDGVGDLGTLNQRGGINNIGNISFDGGGFTGNGARSGGLDGKGGFMAMVHPRETVVDHTKGQSTGGVTIVQNINVTTGVQQTVRAEIATLMPQIANAAKNAVADSRMRGGSYGKALGA
jgi:hypothetical protein